MLAYVRKATFIRNVAILASGTAVAQLLTVLSYPILMRLFDPEDFGLYALLGAITMTVVVIASGRYEMAIVLERDDRGAANVLALSLGCVLAFSVASAAVLALGGAALMRLFGTEQLTPLLPMVPISILVFAAYQVVSYWTTREKAFYRLSVSNVARSFGVSAFQIALGLFRAGPGGLVVGQILGQAVAVLVLGWQTVRLDGARLRRQLSWAEIRRLARAHREFPIYNAPRALMNSTTVTAPSVLLTAFFSPSIAGLYWFAYRLLELPVTLLGDATRRVFYQRAVELHHQGSGLATLYLKTSGGLALLAAGPALAMILAAPPTFEFAFGPEWREAGVFMQWMVGWWLVKFASLPSIMLMPVLRLQRTYLVIEAVCLVPRLAVIPLAAQFGDEVLAIAGYSMVGLAYHLACALLVLHHVRRNDARLRSVGATQPA
jgi:O-antigen/teichoic acid export membrane protein